MDNQFGLRLYEIAPGQEPRIIPINTSSSADFPLTIGRSSDADIHIGVIGRKVLIPHPEPDKRARGEKVPISSLISRTQATIFRDEAGRIRIRDGNGNSSQFGIREGATNKLLRRPWMLGPGAFVKVTPEAGGYRCWLEWKKECEADAPTLGFSQWQNENLQEELDEQRLAIEALNKALIATKKESTKTNRRQDVVIQNLTKALIGITLVVAAISAIALGVDAEFITEIAKVTGVISGIVGIGAVWKLQPNDNG